MKYVLHPEALQDLRDAAAFYRDRGGSNLSQSFLAALEHAVDLMVRHPLLGALWRHGKRRLIIQRFPYSSVYLRPRQYPGRRLWWATASM